VIPDLLLAALTFYREPARFPHLRDPDAPLPVGLTDLLAATTSLLSDPQIGATAAVLNAQEDECRDSVRFFLKQVMLEAEGDYYRILGIAPDAPRDLIKRHYHYLIRIFHPDKAVGGDSWGGFYALRINEAYNTLGNSAKRKTYDAALASTNALRPDAVHQPASPGYASPRPPGHTAYIVHAGGFSHRTKKVAVLLLLLLLLLFFAQRLYRQNQNPNLRVDTANAISTRVAHVGINPSRQDLVAQGGAVRFNDKSPVEQSLDTRIEMPEPAPAPAPEPERVER
jgi:hypothetical protein